MIDVGAASGFFVDEFRKAGWQAAGVEPNASMRQWGQQHLRVDYLGQQLADVHVDKPVGLCTLIQVVSHLLDPLADIQRCRDLLKPEGMLLVETWDRSSLFARCCGLSWHEYNPPSVLHWFSRQSLRQIVESVGFNHLASGLPLKQIQIGRAFTMLRHAGESSWLKWLTVPLKLFPERLCLPYRMGDAFWMLFRRS
jgi:SAM-dependent methyltransferase